MTYTKRWLTDNQPYIICKNLVQRLQVEDELERLGFTPDGEHRKTSNALIVSVYAYGDYLAIDCDTKHFEVIAGNYFLNNVQQ